MESLYQIPDPKFPNPNTVCLRHLLYKSWRSHTKLGFGIWVIGIFLTVFCSPASASYISLNTTLSTEVSGKTLIVNVSTVNKGDEAAYNVQAEIKVSGKTILAQKISELPVGSAYTAQLRVPLSINVPGTYPLVLTMHYADQNQYPFSALTVHPFIFGREAVTPIFGQVKSATFSESGNLEVKLKNLGDSDINASLSLVVPREISIDLKSKDIKIGPRAENKYSFEAKNFSALSGSAYQVFAVAEFEGSGLHYTSVAPGTIRIIAEKKLMGINYTIIFAALALLVGIFIISQFWAKK